MQKRIEKPIFNPIRFVIRTIQFLAFIAVAISWNKVALWLKIAGIFNGVVSTIAAEEWIDQRIKWKRAQNALHH